MTNVAWTYNFRKSIVSFISKQNHAFLQTTRPKYEKQECSLLNKHKPALIKLFEQSLSKDPYKYICFKKEEHKRQKNIKIELKKISRSILFGYSASFGIFWNKFIFTVKVNKSLNMYEIWMTNNC